MKKIYHKLLILFLSMLLSGCSNTTMIFEESEIQHAAVIVNIEGAVKCPGIYEINSSMFMYEILELAGGLLPDADLAKINLVQPINETATIRIPFKTNKDNSSLININTAGVSELIKLQRIGEDKATAIINYRNERGYFKNIEEIKNVPGIGAEIFTAIKTYIDI